MPLPALAALVIAALALGYVLYGRFIARHFALDDSVETPAEKHRDGVDFVPTRPFYLLGQHFSAIAAAGPIVGPIAACFTFGWLPCVLWIALGVIFIGAVHDFTALVASVRHGAKSVCEIVRQHLGRRAWLAILAFIWIALVYVIVAFAHVTAATFAPAATGAAGPGPSVAAASLLYLVLAVVMALLQKRFNPPLWLITIVFVPATIGAVWVGMQAPNLLVLPHGTWVIAIMAYCFVASLLPVWLLLQPRGYLGGFVLYIALAVGVVGIFFGGFDVHQPAFKAWDGPKMDDALFPFLFVTIACGACSGFHGLVCGGTTSRQIARESHCRPVGYGAMLLEGFVALIALATAMIATTRADPGAVYGSGIGRFLTVIIGEKHAAFATVFGSMVLSTFIFDTFDVATRLGRYILEELSGLRTRAAAVGATAATVVVPLLFLVAGDRNAWREFWLLFGASNQLLAALTLLGVTVWLRHTGRPFWFTLIPMAFVMTITVWALAVQAVTRFDKGFGFNASTVNGVVCVLLAGLAGLLCVEAFRSMRKPVPAAA
jgi:carbon starvation protein